MKRILLILAFLICGFNADAAAPATARGRASSATTTAQTARAARTPVARSAAQPNTTATKVVSRSATPVTTTQQRGRSATTTTTQTVSRGRAATKQNVIGSGTKVATAAQNTVVDEACWGKFSGCMDSFCMLDNANGGRCMCSNQNAEYDSILAEIQKLDSQSYEMATSGVDRIEMGEDAEAIMAKTDAITKSIMGDTARSKRDLLDLTQWNSLSLVDDTEETEDLFVVAADDISTKTGDALFRASADLCNAQIPECSSQFSIMDLMYKQRVRSDCTAYENSLKQQRTQSAQKLAAAQASMREAALEQYRNANKYDLGQCTVQFKQCMQTTGGCGDDFSGCVTYDYTSEKLKGQKSKLTKIKGALTTIEIAASTYDTLDAKKPLCMGVTQQCVAVRDQVWDTFLRETAPELKSAELIAESNVRTSCISNISNCFQKACKDNLDPNNPEGSYDMCLTHPDTFSSLCKVEIEPCEAAEKNIMEFVRARLASMRVDSCTNEFKSCLQSEDRCGSDYTQCVGLDTDTIVRLCPPDKLVGCQYEDVNTKIKTNEEIYDELSNIAQGIFLSIDNNMLTQCQKAADAAMIKVCGSTTECNGLTVDDNIGARSLEYKICEYKGNANNLDISYSSCRTDVSQIQDSDLGRVVGAKHNELGPVKPFAGVIDGTIYWQSVESDNDGKLDVASYWKTVDNEGNIQEATKDQINSELAVLQRNINSVIDAIESDPTVQFCMTGRKVQAMRAKQGKGDLQYLGNDDGSTARFPSLTKQMREIIANSALKVAKDNYYKKYDELDAKLHKDYVTIGERMAEIAGENAKDVRRWGALDACKNMASSTALPKSPEPPKGNDFGKIVIAAAAATAIAFTGGTAGAAVLTIGGKTMVTTGTMALAAGATAVGLGATTALSGNANGNNRNLTPTGDALIGSYSLNQWNYKETTVSTFEWETLNCHRCTRSQRCTKTKNPMFGKKWCKDWADPQETCRDIQF